MKVNSPFSIVMGSECMTRGHVSDAMGLAIDPKAMYATDGTYIWRSGLTKPHFPMLNIHIEEDSIRLFDQKDSKTIH